MEAIVEVQLSTAGLTNLGHETLQQRHRANHYPPSIFLLTSCDWISGNQPPYDMIRPQLDLN